MARKPKKKPDKALPQLRPIRLVAQEEDRDENWSVDLELATPAGARKRLTISKSDFAKSEQRKLRRDLLKRGASSEAIDAFMDGNIQEVLASIKTTRFVADRGGYHDFGKDQP